MNTCPYLSIVIPVYNEEKTLPHLSKRLFPSLDSLNVSYEVIFVNDGSKDNSFEVLKKLYEEKPDHVRVIDLYKNAGQHLAIFVGFEKMRGQVAITLDADLQNPPEEIKKVLDKFEEGYDYVSSAREKRKDSFFRTYFSKIANWVRRKITDIDLEDHGCMLRAYSKDVVTFITQTQEPSPYIPALAYKFSRNVAEITVRHEERSAGQSNYNLYKLMRLSFDLMTGFSLVPLQLFTFLGLLTSFFSGILVIYMLTRRLMIGPEVNGVFTLFAITFLLLSIIIVGIGLVGEYIGRIFQSVHRRPPFIIRTVLENSPASFSEKN